ncbi:uncharacterized protein LAESUDRAFT_444535 [Laetiporus sulphureus 93-53]|uniref:Uncharacterized protein n=1 Tax=Laetiporus sulphureus 93-53 TaxID=1314785 RepID=A0A165C0K6_9APHY|nr:uncharacterized protein LAESUDRAFT_444535 [Laetiporus sulphureus 93-53]KZT01982.1 hypothetical protein LAESUDRAFT_444535 [Laetiporus sulphureus 93-53]
MKPIQSHYHSKSLRRGLHTDGCPPRFPGPQKDEITFLSKNEHMTGLSLVARPCNSAYWWSILLRLSGGSCVDLIIFIVLTAYKHAIFLLYMTPSTISAQFEVFHGASSQTRPPSHTQTFNSLPERQFLFNGSRHCGHTLRVGISFALRKRRAVSFSDISIAQ